MAFVKGQSGNPAGREKGSKNRATTELRDFFKQLLEENKGQIIEDLKVIDPLSRLRVLTELASFCLPKLASVQADVKQDTHVTLLYDKLDQMSVVPHDVLPEVDDVPLLGDADTSKKTIIND